MNISSIDNVRRLISQYSLEVDTDSSNEGVSCIICRNLVNDAYQSYCGCQYCRQCIVAHLIDGEKYCVGDKEECKDEYLLLDNNVVVSAMLNKRILKARVHCPNKPCSYITELTRMEEHLSECTQQSMECPFSMIGCETEVTPKSGILTHLHDDTLIHSQLLISLINNLRNDLSEVKEELGRSKLELLIFEEKLREKDVEIGDIRREMLEQRGNMDKQETEVGYQRSLINGLRTEMEGLRGESRKEEVTTMMEDVVTLKKEIVEGSDSLRSIKNTVETLERESKKYRDETRSMFIKLKEDMDKKESAATVTQSPNDVRVRVNKSLNTVESVVPRPTVAIGTFSFTVDKFSARKTAEELILSPYFYSVINGYKLRLQVNPGGFGDGRGTHLSVYIRICKGEYDDVLPWPCIQTFTLSLTNQRTHRIYASLKRSYETAADNLRYTFDKPIDKDNDGFGSPKFVSHADLQSVVGLIVNDSVIVRCVVSAPPRSLL